MITIPTSNPVDGVKELSCLNGKKKYMGEISRSMDKRI